ncbi:MAG TPA: multicopper oxidase family protein [Steroidobacteraceae bacterium]|nr:multicopper oxidase family protein [Steroidobacteraceae bacterium]
MLSRREALKLSSAAAVAASLPALAAETSPPDVSVDIGALVLEVAPHREVRTTGYNGLAPGPLLRLKENQPVSVEITNRTDRPEVLHWHGLFLPPTIDGAIEEGTPAIAPGARVRYTLTPSPAGFRWYHSHAMAMGELTRGLYSGQHGMVMIEPRDDPGSYDQEFFLALHDWDARLTANEDGAMNPAYSVSTVNGKVMGAGEPLRVSEGQRLLLHVLNSSPSEVHWIALAGHDLKVVALDGNPVANPRTVPMLRLAPAERVCALVEMNNPGVWILGEVRRHIQARGMGMIVEYTGGSGSPRWQQPTELAWNYEQFAAAAALEPTQAPILVPLILESKFRGHGAMEGWTINGKAYPDAAIAPLIEGRRYRLQFINKSADDHPLHLHRHNFELRTLGKPLGSAAAGIAEGIRGVTKDVVLVDAQTMTEVEFIADHPGATLFHCHQQSHMDLGFMMLMRYA